MTSHEKFKAAWEKFIVNRRAWVSKEPEWIRKNIEWLTTESGPDYCAGCGGSKPRHKPRCRLKALKFNIKNQLNMIWD